MHANPNANTHGRTYANQKHVRTHACSHLVCKRGRVVVPQSYSPRGVVVHDGIVLFKTDQVHDLVGLDPLQCGDIVRKAIRERQGLPDDAVRDREHLRELSSVVVVGVFVVVVSRSRLLVSAAHEALVTTTTTTTTNNNSSSNNNNNNSSRSSDNNNNSSSNVPTDLSHKRVPKRCVRLADSQDVEERRLEASRVDVVP